MGMTTVGPFYDRKEAEAYLEEEKQYYAWCYEDGGVEEGNGCFCVWFTHTARPKPEDWKDTQAPEPKGKIPERKLTAVQQTLF